MNITDAQVVAEVDRITAELHRKARSGDIKDDGEHGAGVAAMSDLLGKHFAIGLWRGDEPRIYTDKVAAVIDAGRPEFLPVARQWAAMLSGLVCTCDRAPTATDIEFDWEPRLARHTGCGLPLPAYATAVMEAQS